MSDTLNAKKNVFKNKNFALLFGGVLVSNIGHILFNFVMSLYILRIATEAYGADNAPLYQGYYLLVSGIVLVLFMPFGGVMADRLNKVRTMYLTDYIRGLTILIACLLVYITNAPETKMLYLFIMAIILGINSAFFNPASGSLLKFIVDEEEIQQASSYLHGSHSLQNIAGLILGGILYASLGIYVIFIVSGVAYLISGFTEMFIKYRRKVIDNGKQTLADVLREIVVGVKYVFNFKVIFSILMLALFLNFFVVPIYQNGIPYFIEFGLKNESTYLFSETMSVENWYSVIMIAGSVSGIIMSLIISSRPPREKYYKILNRNLVMFVILVSGVGAVLSFYHLEQMMINPTLLLLVAIMFATGFIQVAFNVPISVTIQKKVDGDHLGKVQSVMGVLSQALIPIAGLIGGVLIAKVSIVSLYIFCSVGMIISVLIYVTSKYAKEI